MLVDMPLESLVEYKPSQNKEQDFQEFWLYAKKSARNYPLKEEIIKIDYMVKGIEAYKIFYNGFNGARICGYYLLPKIKKPFPVILWFHGYGGKKQDINHYLKWVLMGYAVLAIDIRGQAGESSDNMVYPAPSVLGYMTKGIFNKENYYYYGVYLDCLKAVDFLKTREEIDINRICLTGSSQGGGLSLATAALDDGIKLIIAEIPYLCHFRRAVEWAEELKDLTYREIVNLIKEYPNMEKEMFKTLSYFDNLNLCSWIKCKTIITCGLQDIVCPPSTIFAVYNHIKSEKQIDILPYYGHSLETVHNFEEKKLEYIINYL